jgi:tetratricopeptide (TPR) repeat protein
MSKMAPLDPYSPCPCGSTTKYKWCCQKAESYAERAQRLAENGQLDAAISTLNEGLVKVPGNPWLLQRKALTLLTQQKPEEAKECAKAVLRARPDHIGAAVLLTRLVLGTEGPVAAAAQFQNTLAHVSEDKRSSVAMLAGMIATGLAKAEFIPAALKHLELAIELGGSKEGPLNTALDSLRANPTPSRWLKDSYVLEETPEGLTEAQEDQFDDALDWADDGLWQSAAAAFELLTADRVAGAAAERNLGICRLWLGEEEAACAALRRWIARVRPTAEAVDLAIVSMLLDESSDEEQIEHVQLSWPLRDRQTLLETLGKEPTVVAGPVRHLDPDDEKSPEVQSYLLLDRPAIGSKLGLTREEVPLIGADLLIGSNTAVLETHDDGRLNGLIDHFTALAGRTIPPAHPRTKVIGQTSRYALALSWHWYPPPDLPEAESKRLGKEQVAHLMTKVWPETPSSQFKGRTPLQVARSGQGETILRAALLQMQLSGEEWGGLVDWSEFRSRFGLQPEPKIDPATVDIEQIHLGRLGLIPLNELDDDRLLAFYRHVLKWGLADLVIKTSHEIVKRPAVRDRDEIDRFVLYSHLAMEAVSRSERELALDWARQGRVGEPYQRRAPSAPHWDMLEIQIKSHFDELQDWVPELAVVLEKHRQNEEAKMVLTARLIDMGLVRLVPAPDRPNDFHLDTRPLYQLMSTYGPRVSTASGVLGVSATKGEIWTPETAPKETAIWTPGSGVGSPTGGEKSRIILPGH